MCGAIRCDPSSGRPIGKAAGGRPDGGGDGCVVVEGEVEDEVHSVSLARVMRGNWPPGAAQADGEWSEYTNVWIADWPVRFHHPGTYRGAGRPERRSASARRHYDIDNVECRADLYTRM